MLLPETHTHSSDMLTSCGPKMGALEHRWAMDRVQAGTGVGGRTTAGSVVQRESVLREIQRGNVHCEGEGKR